MAVPQILKLENFDPIERNIYGTLEVKSASESQMMMSGFVSTDSPDLSNEVVEATSFLKYIDYYQRNAIYCYDHDRSVPIGKVLAPQVITTGSKKGLYLEDIKLTPLPVVKEIIWPLVLDEVLTQQSVGFFSLDGKWVDGMYHHTKVYVIEGSLVPVACNPTATIDAVKQLTKGIWNEEPDWERPMGVEGLIEAHMKGRLRLPSEVRRSFAVDGFKPPIEKSNDETVITPSTDGKIKDLPGDTPPVSKTTDFTDLEVLKAQDCLDTEGTVVAKPFKNQKNYLVVSERIYAAKSEVRGGFVFQIAQPTEKGYVYDWELTALAMGNIMGARGGFHATSEQKSAIIERIAESYKALDKELPTVAFTDGGQSYELSVDLVNPTDLEKVNYSDVKWNSEEKTVIELAIFKNAAKSMGDAIAHWVKSEKGIPGEAIDVISKNLYGWVDVSIYAPVYDTDSLTFLNTIVGLIQQYMTADDEEDQSPLFFNAPEGEAKQVNYEGLAKFFADKAAAQKAGVVEGTTAEMTPEQKAQMEDLRRLLDSF